MAKAVTGLVALVALAAGSPLCQVPVFRYALERWKPDTYGLRVLSDGPLTDSQRALLDQLKPDPVTGSPVANFRVNILDGTDEESSRAISEWKRAFPDAKLPQFIVDSPRLTSARQHPIVWTAPLSSQNLDSFVDSEARQQIAEELVDGTSAVWVLLKCGDKSADEAAEKRLRQRLAHNQRTMKLPTLDAEDLRDGFDPAKLKLKFELITVDRNSADEAFLVKSLLNVEDDLQSDEFADKPMAFPVFGRGRALWALVGDGIADDTIDESCGFLVGACSCQVKAENPGADLLIALDWDALVQTAFEPTDVALPPLMGLSGFRKPDAPPAVPETGNGKTVDPTNLSEPVGVTKGAIEETAAPEPSRDENDTAAISDEPADSPLYVLMIVGVIGALGVVVLLAMIGRQ